MTSENISENYAAKRQIVKNDFESAIDGLGVYGRYQIVLVVLLFLMSCTISMHIIGGTLMAASVSYSCTHVILQEQNCNITEDIPMKLAEQLVNFTSLRPESDPCHKYEITVSMNTNQCGSTENKIREFNFENNTLTQIDKWASFIDNLRSMVTNTTLGNYKCLSYEFDQTNFLSTAVTDMNLICENSWKKEMSQMVLMFGVLIGAFVFGYLTDKFGRKPVLVLGCTIISISTFTLTFVWNYLFYCALQFCNGFSGMGLFVVGFVYAIEVTHQELRVHCGQFLQSSFSLGFMLLAFLGYFIREWRKLNITLSTLTPVSAIFILWYGYESPRWLISKNKLQKAQEIIEKIAIRNKKEVDLTNVKLKDRNHEAVVLIADSKEPTKSKSSIFELIRIPSLRKISLVLCLNWFAVTCVYYGLTFIVTEINGNPFLNLFLSGLVELPANMFGFFIISLWGRRPTVCLCNLICGCALVSMHMFPTDKTMRLVLYLIGKFGATATFSCIYTYTAELYPTPLRGQGVGVCSSVARVGGLTSIAVIMTRYYASYLPFVIYGVISALAGMAILVLPETKGHVLPESIEDSENMYINRRVTLKQQCFCM